MPLKESAKYPRLLQRCWEKGWLFPVEVSCRGFPAQSVWRMFIAIWMIEKEKTAVCSMGEAAERASYWLRIRNEEPRWKPGGGDEQWFGHHCRPTKGRMLRFRIETPSESWIPSDNINPSWPRLHSQKVNVGEALFSECRRSIVWIKDKIHCIMIIKYKISVHKMHKKINKTICYLKGKVKRYVFCIPFVLGAPFLMPEWETLTGNRWWECWCSSMGLYLTEGSKDTRVLPGTSIDMCWCLRSRQQQLLFL